MIKENIRSNGLTSAGVKCWGQMKSNWGSCWCDAKAQIVETESLTSLEIDNTGNTGTNKQTNKEECHLTGGRRDEAAQVRKTRWQWSEQAGKWRGRQTEGRQKLTGTPLRTSYKYRKKPVRLNVWNNRFVNPVFVLFLVCCEIFSLGSVNGESFGCC